MTIWRDEPPTEPGENVFYARQRDNGAWWFATFDRADKVWSIATHTYGADAAAHIFQFCHTPIPQPEQLVEMERKAKMLDWLSGTVLDITPLIDGSSLISNAKDSSRLIMTDSRVMPGADLIEAIEAAMLAEGVTL